MCLIIGLSTTIAYANTVNKITVLIGFKDKDAVKFLSKHSFGRARNFEAAVFVYSFWPQSLLATQAVPTLYSLSNIGRRGFYFQAEHGSLPPHALDMLVTRIG